MLIKLPLYLCIVGEHISPMRHSGNDAGYEDYQGNYANDSRNRSSEKAPDISLEIHERLEQRVFHQLAENEGQNNRSHRDIELFHEISEHAGTEHYPNIPDVAVYSISAENADDCYEGIHYFIRNQGDLSPKTR